ncbi:MAG: hypothetical protein IJW40_11830 [Clostridia bacterium]|nr:hypothetical protein [Clostridia bacterium]MBQ7339124.1 hypothetical protein [Clostridia bacterium]
MNKSRYLKNYFKHNGIVLICELLIVLLLSIVCTILLDGSPRWLAPTLAVAAYVLAELRFMMAYIAKCVKRDRMLEEQARAAAEEAAAEEEFSADDAEADEEFAPADEEDEVDKYIVDDQDEEDVSDFAGEEDDEDIDAFDPGEEDEVSEVSDEDDEDIDTFEDDDQ